MLKTTHHPSRSNAYPNSIMTSDHSRHLHKALDLRCSAWMHGSQLVQTEKICSSFFWIRNIEETPSNIIKHHQTSSNILETSQEIPDAQGHTSGFNFCSPSHALTMPKQKIESGCDLPLKLPWANLDTLQKFIYRTTNSLTY